MHLLCSYHIGNASVLLHYGSIQGNLVSTCSTNIYVSEYSDHPESEHSTVIHLPGDVSIFRILPKSVDNLVTKFREAYIVKGYLSGVVGLEIVPADSVGANFLETALQYIWDNILIPRGKREKKIFSERKRNKKQLSDYTVKLIWALKKNKDYQTSKYETQMNVKQMLRKSRSEILKCR